jgi:hypothetical protein
MKGRPSGLPFFMGERSAAAFLQASFPRERIRRGITAYRSPAPSFASGVEGGSLLADGCCGSSRRRLPGRLTARRGLLAKSCQNCVIALRAVGFKTRGTVLDTLAYFMVPAAIIQEIQGAKAEEAIEGLRVRVGMTGEVLTSEIPEKAVAVLHGCPLVTQSKEGTSLAKLPARPYGFRTTGIPLWPYRQQIALHKILPVQWRR